MHRQPANVQHAERVKRCPTDFSILHADNEIVRLAIMIMLSPTTTAAVRRPAASLFHDSHNENTGRQLAQRHSSAAQDWSHRQQFGFLHHENQ